MNRIRPMTLATPWQQYGNKKPDRQDFFVKYIHSSYTTSNNTTYTGCVMSANIEWE